MSNTILLVRLSSAAIKSKEDESAPAKLQIQVLRAKDLMAMDSASLFGGGASSDPYVKIHIGDDLVKAKKTTVKNKTLNPTWMENFEFQVLRFPTVAHLIMLHMLGLGWIGLFGASFLNVRHRRFAAVTGC